MDLAAQHPREPYGSSDLKQGCAISMEKYVKQSSEVCIYIAEDKHRNCW